MKLKTLGLLLFTLLLSSSFASAQSNDGYYKHVRTTYLNELGVAQARGLSYSPLADAFLFLEEELMLPSGPSVTNIRFVPYFSGLVDSYEPQGPFGAKEIGQGSTLPVLGSGTQAMANASGVWIKDLPITPEKILKASHAKPEAQESVAG